MTGDSTQPAPSARSLLGGSLLVLGLGEVAARGFSFVAMAYLLRTLGRESFGLLEAGLAVLMFCALGVDQGLPVLGAREVARDHEKAPSLVRRVVSLQLLLAAFVFAGLVAVAMWAPLDPVLACLLIGFGFSLFAVPFSLHWVFQGRNQMFWFALPKAVRYGVFCLCAVALVGAPDDVVLLPWAEISAVAVMAALYVGAYRRGGDPLRIGYRGGVDAKLLRESAPVGGSNLIWTLRMYLSHLLIGVVAGAAQVGIFGAAHRILMVYQGGLDVYFTKLFPTMSQASVVSRQELARLLRRSMHLLMWPSLLLALTMSFAAPWVMQAVYSAEQAGSEGGTLLVVLFWLAPVLACRRHGRFALITLNRQRTELSFSILGVIVLIVLLIPLATARGALGAAWAMLISEVVATACIWWSLRAALREPSASRGGVS